MDDYNFWDDSTDLEFQDTLKNALLGKLTAQHCMFGFYFEGKVVKKDTEKAEYWAAKMREHDIGLSDEEHMHIPML